MAVFLAVDCIIDEALKAVQFGCDLFADSNAMASAGSLALGGALGKRGLQATPVLPVPKSAVLILAAVFAAACVATCPPTPQRYRLLGWPPRSCGRTGSTAGCKLLMTCNLRYDRETAEGHAFVVEDRLPGPQATEIEERLRYE